MRISPRTQIRLIPFLLPGVTILAAGAASAYSLGLGLFVLVLTPAVLIPLGHNEHPHSVFGLGDGGAHCGAICDASMTTSLLTHWARDRTRGPKLSIESAVRKMTKDTADLYGLSDRGTVEPGKKADLNVVDLDRLELELPELVHDLPAEGRRLIQRARGYTATLVSGEVTFRDGEHTGALPGKLLRGARSA